MSSGEDKSRSQIEYLLKRHFGKLEAMEGGNGNSNNDAVSAASAAVDDAAVDPGNADMDGGDGANINFVNAKRKRSQKEVGNNLTL